MINGCLHFYVSVSIFQIQRRIKLLISSMHLKTKTFCLAICCCAFEETRRWNRIEAKGIIHVRIWCRRMSKTNAHFKNKIVEQTCCCNFFSKCNANNREQKVTKPIVNITKCYITVLFIKITHLTLAIVSFYTYQFNTSIINIKTMFLEA